VAALSIAKLRVGAEAYQLSGVAQSLDDYYTGAGEAAGRWIGAGAPGLHLSGDVDPDDLRAVLAGLLPGGGGLTPNGTHPVAHPRRVPGFDLTFKVPKSVSVLYAVSDDPRIQGAIIEAGNTAVDHVIGWLEREAVRVRRGSNSVPLVEQRQALGGQRDGIREIETTGLVAASFRHRTSRAGDPFLHWHVLAANMAQGVDGKWSSIVHPQLYSHAKAAGEMFQAVVRDELSRTLGVEWRPGRHVHEIAGVPDEIMGVFSKRATEIDNFLTATGTPADGAGRQAAALATRRSKGEQESTVGLSQRWRTEAIEAGWGPAEVDTLLGTGRPRGSLDYNAGLWRLPTVYFDENGTPSQGERAVDPEEWIADVLRKDLTHDRSTFQLVNAVQAVAARLGEGATVATIERVTDRLISSTRVIPVGENFTSRELLDVETAFVRTLTAPARNQGPDTARVRAVLNEHPALGVDQATAVMAISGAESAVSVLIGPAGTGKTYTLNTIRQLFEDSSWRVIGAAPSARAAAELQSGARITSSTMHSLLARLDQGTERLNSIDVLVIDEAGMADTRTLQQLVTAATHVGARVVLVGDHRQLPEVVAGGGFAYATQHADTVAELAINRRQQQPWEQQALTALRDGNVVDAVDAYIAHRRVIVTPDNTTLIDRAVGTWNQARARGLDAVLVAGTNETVDRLNAAVLDQLTQPGGALHNANRGVYGGTSWRVGQLAVIRRNFTDPTVSVRNGQTGTITQVGQGELSIQLDKAPAPVTLGQRYLDAGGRLSHGYASTIHRTQGGTWDIAISVGLDGLYREGAYTALSRGRQANIICLTHPEAQQLQQERTQDPPRHDSGLRLPTEEPGTVSDELTNRINQRRGKQLAHTHHPAAANIDRLARTLPYPQLLEHAARTAQIERIATATVGTTIDDAVDRIAAAERIAKHLAPGVRVRALDRHNIGTVIRTNDTDATARVRFASANGQEAVRTMNWDDITIIDPDTPTVPHSPRRQAWLGNHTHQLNAVIGSWNDTVHALGSTPGAADLYRNAADLHLERAVGHLAAEQPAWLTNLIGPAPVFPEGRTTWRSTLTDISAFRLTNQIPDTAPGLGLPNSTNKHEWLALQHRIGDTRHWLNDHPQHAVTDWPIRPPRPALLRRRIEVDAILDTAPPDQGSTINHLRSGQLSLDDTKQLLDTAVAGQTERQRWIIANWPHIIEANLVDTALIAGRFGPDTDRLAVDILTTTDNPALYAAAQDSEPWLAAALNHTSQPEHIELDEQGLQWLENIADYRTTNSITSRNPLGPLPHDPEQRTLWNDLADQGANLRQPQPIAAPALSYVENPNEFLLDQLTKLDRPDNGRSAPELGIER
jgi:conjugative relaxase-like TrwC/TraI family protein